MSRTLATTLPAAEIEPPDSFAVNDSVSANWVVRKIAESRAYAKHVKEWAEGELKRAEREEQFFLGRYGLELEDWARKQIASARAKSVKLPAGTVGFRSEPPKLDVTDETRLRMVSIVAACGIEDRDARSEVAGQRPSGRDGRVPGRRERHGRRAAVLHQINLPATDS